MRVDHKNFGELAEEVFARSGRLRFTAGGRSMHPLIRDGDILTIEPVDPQRLRVGDVAFYRPSDSKVVVHRVVGKLSQNGRLVFLIRGDASDGPCEVVPAECILGRAVLLERNGRAVRLDRGPARLAGILWVKLSPWSRRAYLAVQRALRFLRRACRKLIRLLSWRSGGRRPQPEGR